MYEILSRAMLKIMNDKYLIKMLGFNREEFNLFKLKESVIKILSDVISSDNDSDVVEVECSQYVEQHHLHVGWIYVSKTISKRIISE